MALFGTIPEVIVTDFPPLPEVTDEREPRLIREALERHGQG